MQIRSVATTYCGEAREHEGDDHRPGPTLCPFIDFYSSYFVCLGFFFLNSYKYFKTYELIRLKKEVELPKKIPVDLEVL